jgi:acyl-CoA reductase-like NAD-dependent aldehyde dehydrogenase
MKDNTLRRTLDVLNPRTGEADYQISPPTAEDMARICAELRGAQRAWYRAGLSHRIAVMRQWADEIEKHKATITHAEFLDTGRYRIARDVPGMVVAGIRGWCERAPEILDRAHLSGTSSVASNVKFQSQLKPYCLLGIISPWNHPFLLSTLDAIPALLAGCAAVIKPSEITPRFIEPAMKTIAAVPELAKILTYVNGDGETGQHLIEQVDLVCFTGSVGTGRKIAEACARRFIPVFLELGGKDAAVVTASADIRRAAAAVLRGSVHATGQLCFATERVYVHDSIHDAFVEQLVAMSEALELNYPDPHAGHIGPFILRRQASIVDDHIDDAVAKGARVLTGGKSINLGGGLYMRPTVLVDVTHEMKIMQEETFGPVTPVMRYRSEEEAIRLANDSEFGLSGSVIAGSEEEARRIGEEIDAGAISLQDTALTITIMRDAEKNSFNASGMGGSRMGPASILRFLRKKVLMTNCGAPADMNALSEVAA